MEVNEDRIKILAYRFTAAELSVMCMQAAVAGHRLFAETCRQAIGERIVKERRKCGAYQND